MLLAALGCWLGGAAATADPATPPEAVVIAATAPGFRVGQQLGAAAPIVVPDGASLVLLLDTGRVVTVKGPYEGPTPRAAGGREGGGLSRLGRLDGTDQSQIGGTRSLPPAVADLARDVPLDLYLATDRGRYPAYRLGEPLRLVLQTNRDAYVYCWLRTRLGRVVPLFPAVAADAAGPLEGSLTRHLPAKEAVPAALEIEPQLDEATLRCVATPDPLEPDLVRSFIDGRGQALPMSLAERLEVAVAVTRGDEAAGPGTRGLVLAQLVIRVERQ